MIGDRNVDDIVLSINPEVAYFSEMSVTIERKQLDSMSQGTYCGTEADKSGGNEDDASSSGDCGREDRKISSNKNNNNLSAYQVLKKKRKEILDRIRVSISLFQFNVSKINPHSKVSIMSHTNVLMLTICIIAL